MFRQLWALSGIPSPKGGFDIVSVYSNIHYLLQMEKNVALPIEYRKIFPWILWRLWKNRNAFFFKGISFCPLNTVYKIQEDAEMWFLAQASAQRADSEVVTRSTNLHTQWHPPLQPALKCNIGLSWLKRNKLRGGAWVLRDFSGKVLIHSRSVFVNIGSLDELKLKGVLWEMESMNSHHVNNVVFALEDANSSTRSIGHRLGLRLLSNRQNVY